MKAQEKPWGDGTRVKLAEVLPLDTPIAIGIEASSFCNLHCSYCAHGVENPMAKEQFMTIETFKKAIDSLTAFESKVKNIVFALNGEPLMHQQLAYMIEYIKKKDVSEKATVFTNAILLSAQCSEALIDAGLDILRVSIQGVSDDRYLQLCGVKANYNDIVENVRYFYNYRNKKKSKCHIFVKIVDQSFQTPDDQEKFYRDFGDICDQISVETIVPMRLEVEYDEEEISKHCNLLKQEVSKSDVCAQPFYAMYVKANGNVVPCCISDSSNLVLGNVEQIGLRDIWLGEKLKDFRKQQLLKKRYDNSVCQYCNYPECGMQVNDKIDHIAEALYEKMYGDEKRTI